MKTWIVQSRRTFTDHWRDAQAVVLSYRGKKKYQFDVVLKGSEQIFRLDVSLKTGVLNWKVINTKQAAELKEAFELAQR